MALFQPINVIPSSFTDGVVDVNDPMQISWQVNGNSAMTAYKIEFFENNEDSTPIGNATIGKSSLGIPTGGFYGTDRFGKPKMFVWSANDGMSWNSYNPSFVNGQQVKFKITQYWNEGGKEQSITSFDENVFETKDTPQVVIYLSDSTYQNNNDFGDGSILETSIGYFKAEYTQQQGDPVRFARWQLATASFSNNQWRVGEIISDTGDVPTPTLQFEFNGFFNAQKYAVRCLIESEGGQQAKNLFSQNEGWIFFSIEIKAQSVYNGEFTLQCLPKESAALLQWTSKEIPPTTKGDYSVGNGSVALDPNAVIQWEKDGGFTSPWTVALELNLRYIENFAQQFTGLGPTTKTYTSKGFIKNVRIAEPVLCKPTINIDSNRKSCTVKLEPIGLLSGVATVIIEESPFEPLGELAKINLGADEISVTGSLSDARTYSISVNNTAIDLTEAITDSMGASQSKITLAIMSYGKILVYSGGKKFATESFTYSQPKTIRSIQVSGGTTGATFRCATVYKGNLSDAVLDGLYLNADFKPSWYASQYGLHMTANFNGNIDGGEVSKVRIYRQEVGKNSLFPIFYSRGRQIQQVKDYGIVSGKSYTYWLYEYDNNDGYLQGAQCTVPKSKTPATITSCLNGYSLLVCEYDSGNDAYHVVKQYLFSLNLTAGSEGNNNSPTLNANFTPYPTRMPSTQNYISGTLQGLIGTIYTVPALIEQIEGSYLTERCSTLDYFDSVDLEKELYDLSVAPYQLFIRDPKGHLRMISTKSQIGMTPNLKKRQIPLTMSFPWSEIGDASDVSIIQTPDDYVSGSGSQQLDVTLDVDPATGILSASYPKPYEGVKFYLTGVNKEILGAETPVGTTPPQFELSDTATESGDGVLTALTRGRNGGGA